MRERLLTIAVFTIAVSLTAVVLPKNASGSRIEDLRLRIEERSRGIAEIEEEIAQYQQQLARVSQEKETLGNIVGQLELSRERISADIHLKQQKITSLDLSIEKLNLEIEDTGRLMDHNKQAVGESLRGIQQVENETIVEAILTHNSLSEFWENIDTLEQFQFTLQENVEKLAVLKKEVEEKREEVKAGRRQVVSLQRQLLDERDLIVEQKEEQARLLAATENRESAYQELIGERERQKREFEQELFEFESQLRYEIDPSLIPDAQRGMLAWPLNFVYITQYFGKTVAARTLYTSGTHNGVDFRATQGTPVQTVLAGTVEGVGNTDIQRGCYSYGRWILLRHSNGLSSLYAHLSKISVAEGEKVQTGQVIGYSGGTPGTSGAGYSTGPHLHLTLFASQGVEVQKYTSSINCKQVFIPLADRRAYLNPLSYLPSI